MIPATTQTRRGLGGHLLAILTLLFALQLVLVQSTPTHLPKRCKSVLHRKPWQSFSDREKKAYIKAELCLMWQKPSRTDHPTAVSLFDDLQGAHQMQALRVHFTGWFLPWHRYMMFAHEKLLREECGYRGAQPYWDESPEAGNFTKSSVFDPITGFGDIGLGPGEVRWIIDHVGDIPIPGAVEHVGKCLAQGPFANYTLHIGPTFDNTPHCISRNVNNTASLQSAASEVQICLGKKTFAEAWPCIETTPHSGGHGGVDGEMANSVSSPGDPLFYLHHTWLDKVWWDWQKGDVKARKYDLAGNTSALPIELADGSVGFEKAKLGDVLNMGGLVPDTTVGEALDIEGGLMACIEYVD